MAPNDQRLMGFDSPPCRRPYGKRVTYPARGGSLGISSRLWKTGLPCRRGTLCSAVAQLVERLTVNQDVAGSNPASRAKT